MKVFIDGKMYDAEETAITLIFENDKARKVVGTQILGMEEREGQRYFCQYPEDKYTAAGVVQMLRDFKG